MQFRDLKTQYTVLKNHIDKAISDVLDDCNFIGGKHVAEFEEQLAEYVGVKHCISCANGTDALTLALFAWKIGKNDAVFVPDFTFFSSGESPAGVGAMPIFVDVNPITYNMDPEKLEEAIIQVVKEKRYTPRAVITVDLFGQPADYSKIKPICGKYHLLLLEDGAQGFGGRLNGKKACGFGDISTTSFFPAKPLGCYGDGGAIFTDNDEWAALIRSFAVHGKSETDKYDNVRIGMNSRLDTVQAAILQVKFKAFQNYELDAVNQIANWYHELLKGSNLIIPQVLDGAVSSWAQYTVQLPDEVDRNCFQIELKKYGIPTMIYYAKPMHQQKAFAGMKSSYADCPVTKKLCDCVLSLPLSPYMEHETIERVADGIYKSLENIGYKTNRV